MGSEQLIDDINDRARDWQMILSRNCKTELAKLRREYPKSKSLIIPYGEVQRFGSVGLEIADEILENPAKSCEDIKNTIEYYKIIETEKHDGAKDIIPRFTHLPRKTAIKDLRERHIGCMLAVDVQIKRVSDILPRCTEAVFRCPAGHFSKKTQPYNSFIAPDGCQTDGCNFKKLEFIPKRSEFTDTQRVLVQEILDNSSHAGEQPKTMSAEVMGDLCGRVFPGDRVVINAILRSYQVTKAGQLQPVFRTYFEVNNIEISQREYEEVDITDEEEKVIKALAKDKDILHRVGRSIAPSVYGMDAFKEAIALSLFSGRQAINQYGETKRMDIHVLGCGDPALAKSKVARYAIRVAPRGIMSSGLSSTKAGLTVTVTKDESTDGRFVADAGAMCLADLGVFFLDELGDLPKPDQAILHEAMEEQSSSYAKAGLVGSYNTRCSVISCMNPKLGRFDKFADLADQVDIKSALLSRFDLIFLMIDEPENIRDKGIMRAILNDGDGENTKDDQIITVDMLRKYIAYSKKQKNPVITTEAKAILEEYYLKVRGAVKAGQPIPITARAGDTLKRLSVAHAKMRLSDTVSVKDAEAAVKMLDQSLKNAAMDPVTGKMDADRINGGMSKHKRNLVDSILESVKILHVEQGAVRKPDIAARLVRDKIAFADTELERVLSDLTRLGHLSESKGIYTVM